MRFGSSKPAEADDDDDRDDDDDDEDDDDEGASGRAHRKAPLPASPSRPDEELFLETMVKETPQLGSAVTATGPRREGADQDARSMRYGSLKPQTAMSRQTSKQSALLPARLPTLDTRGMLTPEDKDIDGLFDEEVTDSKHKRGGITPRRGSVSLAVTGI
jgi:hypothetical protein